jgi:pimeloyl-ACP methyl ester carboxylesterase
MGYYDYTVNYNLAKEYYNKIIAPEKGFYTFDNSAHSPIFEEPEKANEILIKYILK